MEITQTIENTQKIQSLGLDSESQVLLVEEMGHPVDMDAIVTSASSPEIAAEKGYLAMLAAPQRSPSKRVKELENQVAVQKSFAQSIVLSQTEPD